MDKKLELKLITSNTVGGRQKYRKGICYYPMSGIFISTTEQIHICTFTVKFPVETKEGSNASPYINSWMETLKFTRCGITAPFHKWISAEGTGDLREANIANKLCYQCGNLQDFRKILRDENKE